MDKLLDVCPSFGRKPELEVVRLVQALVPHPVHFALSHHKCSTVGHSHGRSLQQPRGCYLHMHKNNALHSNNRIFILMDSPCSLTTSNDPASRTAALNLDALTTLAINRHYEHMMEHAFDAIFVHPWPTRTSQIVHVAITITPLRNANIMWGTAFVQWTFMQLIS